MDFPFTIDIDLLAFIKTGKFDCLKLGQTKEYIYHNFPNPDNFSSYKDLLKDNIWRYGNIELHFENEKLSGIFSDYISTLDAGKSISLHRWILSNHTTLTLLDVIIALNQERIDFEKRTNDITNSVVLRVTDSEVELGFFPQEELSYLNADSTNSVSKSVNQNTYLLGYFSKK